MRHKKTLLPRPNPLTVVFGLVELVIMALPLITDHVPTPILGILPDKTVVGDAIQIF